MMMPWPTQSATASTSSSADIRSTPLARLLFAHSIAQPISTNTMRITRLPYSLLGPEVVCAEPTDTTLKTSCNEIAQFKASRASTGVSIEKDEISMP